MPTVFSSLLPLGGDGELAHEGLHVARGGDAQALLDPPISFWMRADPARNADEPLRDGGDVLGPQLHLLQGVGDVLALLDEGLVEDVAALGLGLALDLHVALDARQVVLERLLVEGAELARLREVLGGLLLGEVHLARVARRGGAQPEAEELAHEHAGVLDDALDDVLPRLHGLGELHFLLRGEKVLLADLAQVQADGVVDRGFLVAVDQLLAVLARLLLLDLEADLLVLELDVVLRQQRDDFLDAVGVHDGVGEEIVHLVEADALLALGELQQLAHGGIVGEIYARDGCRRAALPRPLPTFVLLARASPGALRRFPGRRMRRFPCADAALPWAPYAALLGRFCGCVSACL